MSNKVWVYIDLYQGRALPVSWEMLAAGRTVADRLGCGLTAVVLGYDVECVAINAFYYGADEVILIDDKILRGFRTEPFTKQFVKLAEIYSPEILIFPYTSRGRDLAAMVSVDLNSNVIPDCEAFEIEDGKVIATRAIHAGKVQVKEVCNASPQIITIRSRVFEHLPKNSTLTGKLTRVEADILIDNFYTIIMETAAPAAQVKLTDAAVVVAGGKGVANAPSRTLSRAMKSHQDELNNAQKGFDLIHDLARVLNGAVGATRGAVDAGYISYRHQIGQTGKIISPDLFIACGISGSTQHLMGMRKSKVIVAINNDPDAPIFKYAHYGICGDMYAILPEMIEILKKLNK